MWRWGAAVVLVAGLLLYWTTRLAPVPVSMMSAFRASGAAPSGYSINDWVMTAGRGVDLKTLLARLERGARACGTPARVDTRGADKLFVRCRLDKSRLRLVAETVSGRVYVVADAVNGNGLAGLDATVSAVTRLLSPFGRVRQSLTLEGTLPGLFGRARDRRLVARMLAAGNAEEVDAEQAREWVSVSAFSRSLGRHAAVGRAPVNMEVAVVRDRVRHNTEVLLGSPLIAVPY